MKNEDKLAEELKKIILNFEDELITKPDIKKDKKEILNELYNKVKNVFGDN